MLDVDTKRRIDTARDILVGKVPDPKSQVEQITIALIYKFMDDLDAQSEELGGDRKFFAGDFARYGWAKLMHHSLGGYETLNLYAEAITRMPENPGIPLLFREIFNNAYLPYRDPETLRVFLKVIDEFTYDHSEKLGDAFEYLLSVLGAQGDAGQFRTPRHIIDFIVAVVDPKKDETVLDPACGTGGFLISAYKHILAANTDANGQSTLTPDDRGRLVNNFKGYDISPDMVRLSLVNMYLHGFREPHIYEYDTLTSDERWNEYADVILANPPFMSPRGGIRPHNRFSVQSTRSEVLFVDYMAEHLSPEGRAGIIVPEGIIFQSQNAYKQLRKMLVDEYLVAVVSLPTGVFNPYSGVKTSILILDRALAKRTDSIAFFKVDYDGFELGAQRRRTDRNDLPRVQAELGEHFRLLRVGESVSDFHTTLGQVVAKDTIAADGEYYLSGERYRQITLKPSEFPFARIGEVCLVNPRMSQPGDFDARMDVSFVPMADVNEHQMTFQPLHKRTFSETSSSHTYFEENDVLLAKVTPCFENGKAGVARGLINGIGFGSSEFYVLRPGEEILPEWVYFCVMHSHFRESAVAQMTGTGGLQRVPRKVVENFQIPLPPLEVQREIVAEVEGYQKVIDGARAVVENYRPYVAVDPEWPKYSLGALAENLDSRRVPVSKGHRKPGLFPYYGASGIVDYVDNYIFDEDILLVSEDGANLLARSTPIAFSISGKSWVNNHAHVLRFETLDAQKYVEYYLNTVSIQKYVTGSAQPKLNQQALSSIQIPLPDDRATLQGLISEVEAEHSIIEANRELIQRFEGKIRAAIGRMWGAEASVLPDA